MSVGLLCDCTLPPLDGLKPSDGGHYRRSYAPDQRDCPQYAADQKRGGLPSAGTPTTCDGASRSKATGATGDE